MQTGIGKRCGESELMARLNDEQYTESTKMVVKRKKWRKPLTEEQKAERRERLVKARQAKAPPKYVTVHSSVRELPDDHYLSLMNVRAWLKKNKQDRQRLKYLTNRKLGDKSTAAEYYRRDTYVQNLESYVRTGIWNDLFYGEDQEHRIKYKCTSMAYWADGTPKRSLYTWYPDIGEYTREMANADANVKRAKHV